MMETFFSVFDSCNWSWTLFWIFFAVMTTVALYSYAIVRLGIMIHLLKSQQPKAAPPPQQPALPSLFLSQEEAIREIVDELVTAEGKRAKWAFTVKVHYERIRRILALTVRNQLKAQLILRDTEEWQNNKIIGIDTENGENIQEENEQQEDRSCLTRVGGVDISYSTDNVQQACVSFVVIQLPSLKVIYEDTELVDVEVEYVLGFLVEKIKRVASDFFPQVILVDGNGILHPDGFGLACHLGLLLDVPSIGVAKDLHLLPDMEGDDNLKAQIAMLESAGDSVSLSVNGEVLGKAVKTCSSAEKPVYVSIGHKCELNTAVWVVMNCSIYHVPEPIRQADIRSSDFLLKYLDTSQLGD